MQTWSDETWFYIKAIWKDDVHNLTIYRFMHCYRNVTCSEVIGELQPHQHRTWSSHQGSADSPALICVQWSCAGHEASQWFESTEGQVHGLTFGEDFVLWVLLWLKRPLRDMHCLPHTEHLLCRVMSSQMTSQSNLGVAYLLTVWTEHFWWGLCLVGLAVAEEANAWQAPFATHWECALLSREFSDDFTVQSWSCIPSHSVDRTLLVRILSCGSCCGWRGQCVTGTVSHTLSICSVESWVIRWSFSPILELHTLSVWTEHFWWGLCLVGLAVAEEANAWQALFVTNQACKL